jgi:hypothetical protein
LYDPDKFQTIAVGKKTYVKEPVFNIESANIACDEIVKLLGFSFIVAVSFIGGRNRRIRRKPPTCHKSLTNCII